MKWDGVDLSGMLLNGAAIPERDIYISGPRWRTSSLRRGDWKLIVSGEMENRSVELFNIARDPSEKNNLAKQETKRVKVLMERLRVSASADQDSVVEN